MIQSAGRLRRLPVRTRLGGILALVAACLALALVGQKPAYGDAHAPPAFPASCDTSQPETYPGPQFPPPGYPNPPPSAATPYVYAGPAQFGGGKAYSGVVRYEVPFKAIINGGSINLPPNVKIPNLYASLCGWVQLPDLSGTIQPSTINIATPNVYVAGLEALPANVAFGTLTATMDPTPAHNGGLDITLAGPTNASVSTLGMNCGITLNAMFTTKTDGKLSGQPVTGPTMQGQAAAVSNSFAVPAVQTDASCPPSIAQTFNKLLGLPAPAGLGTFETPFCFDFELQGINQPKATGSCPWP
ncbi:MAG TPA: hypothetical protein VFJ79_02390 [Acidimicrobiales bacterium]|nr:hypothetical protein [Acidimicrobiales bacterium]